jgi:predicted Fe-Mo cluster-binding NifX family protein
MLIDRDVDAVVVRNIGHNALVTLRGAGIRVYGGASGVVADALELLKKDKLASTERPTVGFQDGLEETE